jgi:NAD(P)-dependent dehydrogenase (short-subunit alcohol dehydrogenase family)
MVPVGPTRGADDEQGLGRIVNVTTKLDTMNRPHNSPYGASKAALEMATEVWAKEVEGIGLTINIVRSIPTVTRPNGRTSQGINPLETPP